MYPKNWKIWTKNEGRPPPHIKCANSPIPFFSDSKSWAPELSNDVSFVIFGHQTWDILVFKYPSRDRVKFKLILFWIRQTFLQLTVKIRIDYKCSLSVVFSNAQLQSRNFISMGFFTSLSVLEQVWPKVIKQLLQKNFSNKNTN